MAAPQARGVKQVVQLAPCGGEQCTDELEQLCHQLQIARNQIDRLDRERVALIAANKEGSRWHIDRGAPDEQWRAKLQVMAVDRDAGEMTWAKVWKLAYSQENISTDLDRMHPGVNLMPNWREDDPMEIDAIASPNPEQHRVGLTEFALFERLPIEVQERIFRLWLEKPGKLIHCFSRLDPYDEPRDPDAMLAVAARGNLHRFHWGSRDVSLTKEGKDPKEVLKILLVSKRWNYLGAHVFYGLNTFAFSSFGELERFCSGSGQARVSRMRHIELVWKGGQPWELDNEKDRWRQARTRPLEWLQLMARLSTLAIHIEETGRDVIRRPNEPRQVIEFMERKTRGQPNARMTRALRRCNGMDHIHQLRGLHWIRLYDLQKAVMGAGRVMIRDESFLKDLNTTAQQRKVQNRARESRLSNLPRLFNYNRWSPGAEDRALVADWYEETCGYDGKPNILDKKIQNEDRKTPAPDSDDSDSDNDGWPRSGRRDGPRGGPGLKRPSKDDYGSDADTPPPKRQQATSDPSLPTLPARSERTSSVASAGSMGPPTVPRRSVRSGTKPGRGARRPRSESRGLFVTPRPSEARAMQSATPAVPSERGDSPGLFVDGTDPAANGQDVVIPGARVESEQPDLSRHGMKPMWKGSDGSQMLPAMREPRANSVNE